jgi:hypothetical protein
MPRGVPAKKRLDSDQFIDATVKYLAGKSPDAQELLLNSIQKELKAANAAGAAPKKTRKSRVAKAAPGEPNSEAPKIPETPAPRSTKPRSKRKAKAKAKGGDAHPPEFNNPEAAPID